MTIVPAMLAALTGTVLVSPTATSPLARSPVTATPVATGPVAPSAPRPQSFDEARVLARSGDYDGAARALGRILRSDPGHVPARRELVRTLLTVGEYERAEDVAREAPDPVGLANLLGEALQLRGRLPAAETSFRVALGELPPGSLSSAGPAARLSGGAAALPDNASSERLRRADDHLTAAVNLADLLFHTGRIDEAELLCDEFIDIYNARVGSLDAAELLAVGRAVHRLARSEPALFQDALRAFDEAGAADPGWPEPRARAGALLLEKYQSSEAQSEFEAVLSANPNHPEALLGMARALIFDGRPGSDDALAKLLDINPNHAEGRALLASIHLRSERHEEARTESERILAGNPSSLAGLTALAATYLLSGDRSSFDEARARALAVNPRYAALDTEAARLLERHRRYAEAAERAAAATRLDPKAWEAHGMLGLNQMRMGMVEEGRANLERAFAGDPYNPWFKNSLDLLDTFGRYELHSNERFDLFLHETEADLLHAYLAPIAEEAYDSLARRYLTTLSGPVRVELYPSHADFSVRTLGEAGLGALGVSFGPVLVMDSPGARELGDYNWASVFWHELAHSFHLGISRGRVPRWFSEGLAVHEQRQARPGWGHQASPAFLNALKQGDLKPVSELDDGFMRPAFPGQVVLSYYQASLVFQYLEVEHGFAPIRDLLTGYGEGRSTEELVESELGMSLDGLDREFDRYLKARFADALDGLSEGPAPLQPSELSDLRRLAARIPDDPLVRLRLGAALTRAERHAEARPHLEAALRLFPEVGGAASPHWPLAQGFVAEGDTAAAIHHLRELLSRWEAGYEPLLRLADLLTATGRPDEAAAALDDAVLIWPYDIDLHRRLAALHTQLGSYEAAVRERRAVVALGPPDRAQARYLLATALRDAGDVETARREVLLALEIAPNFEEALELLLELRRERVGPGRRQGVAPRNPGGGR